MVNIINMQDMRYLNLFGKVTKVITRFCFRYNENIVFCVPKGLVSKAIGSGGNNVRTMNRVLRKKIKIIASPDGIQNAKEFIGNIVSPVRFKDLEIKEDEIIITAGSQSKAALIGRNKRRLLEMQNICKSFFGKEVRII